MTSVTTAPDNQPIQLPADLDTPCAIVDLPVLLRNLERMAKFVGARGQVLRPHAKTHSCTEIGKLQLSRGAVGLTVGTLRMAEAFAAAGFGDLFIASPLWPVGPTGKRLRTLHEAIRLTVGVDSAPAAQILADAVAGTGRRLGVMIEVDSGDHRSGVRPSDAGALARAAEDSGLDVRGIFTHGGHGYASPTAAREAALDEARSLELAADALDGAGVRPLVLSAGSTPTVCHTQVGKITEQRPGTYAFNDRQQVGLEAAAWEDVAFVVAATVTSATVPGQCVLNAGAKALAKDKPTWLNGHGALLGYPDCVITRVFDFHAVVEASGDSPLPELGEVVTIVPNHVCAAVNLARELLVVEEGRMIARWPIDARG